MITAVVMVGEAGGESAPVAWVQGARRAAARDLIAQLARQPQVARIVLVSADADGLLSPAVTDYRPTPPAGYTLAKSWPGSAQNWPSTACSILAAAQRHCSPTTPSAR